MSHSDAEVRQDGEALSAGRWSGSDSMNVTETETGPLNGPSRFKDSEPRHLILAKHNQSDFKRNLFYFCPYGQ